MESVADRESGRRCLRGKRRRCNYRHRHCRRDADLRDIAIFRRIDGRIFLLVRLARRCRRTIRAMAVMPATAMSVMFCLSRACRAAAHRGRTVRRNHQSQRESTDENWTDDGAEAGHGAIKPYVGNGVQFTSPQLSCQNIALSRRGVIYRNSLAAADFHHETSGHCNLKPWQGDGPLPSKLTPLLPCRNPSKSVYGYEIERSAGSGN